MKQKLSVTLEESTIKNIEFKVTEGVFRNKSHLVEFAIQKLISEGKNG